MTTTLPRWTRWLLGLGLGALGLLLLGVGSLWLLARQASAIWPRQVPAIEVPAPPFAVDEAAWIDFLVLTRQLEGQDLGWLSEALAGPGPPAPTALERWREHAATLEAMDRLLARGGLAAPSLELDDKLPPALPALHLGWLRLLRAWWHAAHDEPSAAVADLQATLRLGVRLEHSGGSLLLPMVGLGIQDGLVDEASALLEAYPDWPAAALAPLVAELAATAHHPAGLLTGLAAECRAQERMLRRMAGLSTWQLLRQAGEVLPLPAAAQGGGSWFFDVDATAALARQRCQRRLVELARPSAQRQPLDEPRLWQGEGLRLGAVLDNPVGRILLDIGQPATERFMERSDRVRARRGLLTLRLGVLLHQQAHAGARTASLEALVPEPLPLLPLDPYTGQSFVLDAAAGTLASAGTGEDGATLRMAIGGGGPSSAPAAPP